MNSKPSWGLIIVNCQQEKTLYSCLKLAAEQTYEPSEVIIVDASRHWKIRYERIVSEVFDRYRSIRWVYLTANGRSPSRQRHDAIRTATADVVFLFDENLLMYPNCAEEIMRVYEADPAGLLPGVQACLTAIPPATVAPANVTATHPRRTQQFLFGAVQNFIGQLLRIGTKLPRFPSTRSPKPGIPAAVQQLNVAPIKSSQQSCMTYRWQGILDEQFEPLLLQYAMYEDSSVTYLPARHRPAVKALDAKVYRCRSGSKGLRGYQTSILSALSQPPTKTLLS